VLLHVVNAAATMSIGFTSGIADTVAVDTPPA
jgi:hypothetical protein